jgi:hypothetical protein
LIATRCFAGEPTATLVALAPFVAVTTFVFLMDRTTFFLADFPPPSGRFRFAEGRRLVATCLVLLFPAGFLLLPFTLRSPVTPVLFLTFATFTPRLLQQMLHEFGIRSVS